MSKRTLIHSRKQGSALLGVLALVSALCFLALIAMQVMEFLHYRSAPSVWPG